MKGLAHSMIELSRMARLEHDGEIVAIDPVALHSELLLYPFVKHGTWQRVGKRDPDIVWTGPEYEGNRLLQFCPRLAWIAELQKITGPDARSSQSLSRPNDRLQFQSLIHCIENCLRPGLDAHPDFSATSCFERAHGLLTQEICARLDLERH